MNTFVKWQLFTRDVHCSLGYKDLLQLKKIKPFMLYFEPMIERTNYLIRNI